MKNYTLGLKCGGLMEDPEWHIEHIVTVQANNLDEAKEIWAEETGHNDPEYWDSEDKTYWGWSVVEV